MLATLNWTANAGGDSVTNYKVYYGNAPGTYNGASSPISVGNVTTYDFTAVTSGAVYFALTAENATGESSFSSERSKADTRSRSRLR